MNQLPVQRASELSIDSAPLTHWLVQGLWSDQAVGILVFRCALFAEDFSG